MPWHRKLAAGAFALVMIFMLAAAGYTFVLKSMPYQTPQLAPPQVQLSEDGAASFLTYPAGLPEVPVLTWRDVSHRKGHLVVTPAQLATQLAVLHRNGFRSVRLSEMETLAGGRPAHLPARPVLLTFDDGLSVDWTTVDPILRRYGFSAVVFINPANVALKSPSYFLTPSELQSMTSSGRWEIGLELPGPWRSGQAAVQAASAARSKLQAATGGPVAAFAWPALQTGSATERQEPAAMYTPLFEHFDEVFGRPSPGTARFVVSGSARAPLPRLNITAADSLQSLSVRLRTGVQAPPPADPLTLPWVGAGGDCVVSQADVKLTARRFALCTVVANGARWRDYGLRLRVTARPGVTAIVELRNSDHGVLEVAVGTGRVAVKQRTGTRWTVLKEAAIPGAEREAVSGARSLPVYVGVSGGVLTVQVGRLTLHQPVSARVRNGVISLGMATTHHATTVYRRLAIVRPSAR
jgi:poly-beta-1,6-N-acetyl-D-glucosamine N-deacetylase